MAIPTQLPKVHPKARANPRTLCLDTAGALLEACGGHFVVRLAEDGPPIKLPALAIRQIIIECGARARSSALKLAMQAGIPVSFFGPCGEFLGHTQPPLSPAVGLRIAQYRAYGDTRIRLALARRIVHSKLESCLRLLQAHQCPDNRKILRPAIIALEHGHRQTSSGQTFDVLRGIEGAAARAYFAAVGFLLPSVTTFSGRNRQPPTDPANALLSYGYSVLLRDLAGKLELAGLDPYVGCLHETGYGSAALALDLAEPLRVLVIDHLVLQLAPRCQPADFESTPDGVRIGRDLKQRFFEAY